MSALVLDTNVVSYLMRASFRTSSGVDPLSAAYRPLLEGHLLLISFMTVAELFEGAFRAGWGEARISRLEQVLRG